MNLNPNAMEVLRARYLLKDEKGEICETPEALFRRVAEAVAQAEKKKDRARLSREFFKLMESLRFLPNSPTLMNAGKPQGQLSACYVLPVEDDLKGIFTTLRDAALIHQSGGGTGFDFSRLRQKGATVRSSQGTASGPISFMKIFDGATEQIKQGGTRRGANMGILRVDHPDIEEFIASKRDGKSITNFNISVAITREFMQALEEGREIELKPYSGKTARLRSGVKNSGFKRVSARKIWDLLIESAWACGDPGVIFIDQVNRLNPTPQVGEMESTNPCGEQPLLPFESCNLGSINLGAYVSRAPQPEFDWKGFDRDVVLATRFLDNVIEVNHYPVAASAKITYANRKIGLGVMGLADALLLLGMKYDSDAARTFGETVMARLERGARRASAALATERGAFKNFKGSLWNRLGYPKLRNATVSTVAPTGTISLIAGCSSGIEPIFATQFSRHVLDGRVLNEVHPVVAELRALGARAPEGWQAALQVAGDVSIEGHVGMQARFQRFSDSAVSKTINLPSSATRAEVERAYRLAYTSGCKGITVFRDQSKGAQVLVADDCEICID